VKINTPIPPIQEEKERQNRMPRGRDSTSVRIEAPVVVKPETISKKQSAKEANSPENQKGRAPNKLRKTQMSPTTAKPSREKKSGRARRRTSRLPSRPTNPMVYKKGLGSSR